MGFHLPLPLLHTPKSSWPALAHWGPSTWEKGGRRLWGQRPDGGGAYVLPPGVGVGGMQECSEERTSDPKPTTSKYQVGKLRCREGLGMPGAKGFKDGQEEANATVRAIGNIWAKWQPQLTHLPIGYPGHDDSPAV